MPAEALRTYLRAVGNLVLTDYIEFRWYPDGELRLAASLPRPGRDDRIRWNEDAASEVAQLLHQFVQADIRSSPRRTTWPRAWPGSRA